MTDLEHVINVARLLESGTWIAEFVKRLANASAKEGHDKFAEDVKYFRTLAEECADNYKFEMALALRAAIKHPGLFKNPVETIDSFEDE